MAAITTVSVSFTCFLLTLTNNNLTKDVQKTVTNLCRLWLLQQQWKNINIEYFSDTAVMAAYRAALRGLVYSSGFQPVVWGPPVVLEGVPGGPQTN